MYENVLNREPVQRGQIEDKRTTDTRVEIEDCRPEAVRQAKLIEGMGRGGVIAQMRPIEDFFNKPNPVIRDEHQRRGAPVVLVPMAPLFPRYPFPYGGQGNYHGNVAGQTREGCFSRAARAAGWMGNYVRRILNGAWGTDVNDEEVFYSPVGAAPAGRDIQFGMGNTQLSPFQFVISGTVGQAAVPELEFVFQYNHHLNGYLFQVHDEGVAEGVEKYGLMKNPAIHGQHWQPLTPAVLGIGQPQKPFSPTHVPAVANEWESIKEKAEAGDFDAHTKLVAEGARFHCVRNHVAGLQNDSVFFTNIAGLGVAPIYHGVTFQWLWTNWNAQFQMAFNLTDAQVAGVVGVQGNVIVPRSGVDYDLDLGRAHP